MRLGTLQTGAGIRPVGVVDTPSGDRFVDLLSVDGTLPNSLRGLLAADDGLMRCAMALALGQRDQTFLEGRLLAPIPDPGKVICIGLNYRDHAAESGMAAPSEPVCFSKFSSAVTGTESEIRLPRVARQVDYEAELVAIIGRRAKHVSQREALTHVAGYANGNDVSARDWQLGRPGGQWLLGKTPDTFAPVGPWLVTADEVGDPGDLRVSMRLNGRTMQDSRTKEFIFSIEQIIAHLSQLITLEPGDLIFTGTPPGVGMARKPPLFLQAGDTVEVEIERLGILRNRVVSD